MENAFMKLPIPWSDLMIISPTQKQLSKNLTKNVCLPHKKLFFRKKSPLKIYGGGTLCLCYLLYYFFNAIRISLGCFVIQLNLYRFVSVSIIRSSFLFFEREKLKFFDTVFKLLYRFWGESPLFQWPNGKIFWVQKQ